MLVHDIFRCAAPVELRFTDNEPAGTFTGLASVYGNIDSHGDVVAPGAFIESLAERQAQGRGLPKMYLQHSAWIPGGKAIPCGKWDAVQETADGLHVKGHLICLDHPDVKQAYDLMREGELGALSIAFSERPGGTVRGTKAGEPKRLLKAVNLYSIDLVSEPSNALARIDSVKSFVPIVDPETAVKAIARAMALHQETTSGGNAPNAEQRAELMQTLSTAHRCLTGQAMPPGMKAMPPETMREFEAWMRAEFGWAHAFARSIAENGFKSALQPRDEGQGEAAKTTGPDEGALADLRDVLSGFSLPSFKG
jgi:HK97 family phage prohead protease